MPLRSRQSKEQQDIEWLREQDPALLSQAWPLLKAMIESNPKSHLERLEPEWASALCISSDARIRQWSRDNIPRSVSGPVLENLNNGYSHKNRFEDFFRSGDSALWDQAIETLGARAILAKSETPLLMMLAANSMHAEDFGVFLKKIDAADHPALSNHLREGCWVIEQRHPQKLRKKGDFLAWCVARNLPRHAAIAKALFAQDNPLPMVHARDVMKYCRERDPENYGSRVTSAWERVLLDDILIAAKASVAQEPQSSSKLEGSAPASESPAAAPRRRRL